MPKENKKRGRRADKKRKLEAQEDEATQTKRIRQDEVETNQPDQAEWDTNADYVGLGNDGQGEEQYPQEEGSFDDRPFFGLLDEEEQEYFRKAGEMLDLNEFPSPEDRESFVDSVYREADGKELKVANSQSCSRILERLIQLSSPKQLKILFQKFNTKYVACSLVTYPY